MKDFSKHHSLSHLICLSTGACEVKEAESLLLFRDGKSKVVDRRKPGIDSSFLSPLPETFLEMKNSNFQRYPQYYINPSQGRMCLGHCAGKLIIYLLTIFTNMLLEEKNSTCTELVKCATTSSFP